MPPIFIQSIGTGSANQSGIAAAAIWLLDALSGPIAIAVATIAVASLGFAMLNGRIELRRGIAVIAGCFVLFGAKSIAAGLMGFAETGSAQSAQPVPAPNYPNPAISNSAGPNNNGFDPYAGAAVPR